MQEQPVPTTGSNNENVTRRRSSSIQSMYGHPAHARVALQQAAQDYYGTRAQDDLELAERGQHANVVQEIVSTGQEDPAQPLSHTNTKDDGGKNQSRLQDGALNVRAVILHVAGDAAASVGVVVSGLIMWFTKSRARFYADPTLSLAITILIACSAVPLGTSSHVNFFRLVSSLCQLLPIDS